MVLRGRKAGRTVILTQVKEIPIQVWVGVTKFKEKFQSQRAIACYPDDPENRYDWNILYDSASKATRFRRP